MKEGTYNGWANRETWLVPLWFNPVTVDDVNYLESTLEDDFYEMIGSNANIYSDMIDFNAIDWREIRESLDPADKD
tara:strand:- start:416 stop:643 length:228 start_codon:yes stop_codon:yes gene_type:complete